MFSQNKNGETYHTYGYTNAGWSDLLTSFDGGTITYDTIGNPLTYHDGKVFTWTAGRKLSTVTDGDSNYTYAYDGDGNRISKTVDGQATDYYYIDGKLLGLKKGQDTLLFLYDETGTAYGFLHNGTLYYYDINLQGDVVGIYNGSGNLVASYTYDVWGAPELTSDNALAALNPLRYRGYFYDEETGFYYLQSRYYNPEVGRFISSDGYVSTGTGVLGYNMFAYCNNNPVLLQDSSGSRPIIGGGLRDETPEQRRLSFSYINPQIKSPYNKEVKKTPKKASNSGVAFIGNYEGFSPTPYDDGYGTITIGYGHVIKKGEDLTRITEEQALVLLSEDMQGWEKAVSDYSDELGIVWDQNEYDAFVSLAYNSGYYFQGVMRDIKNGSSPYDAFGSIIKSGGKPSLGLYRRRMDEADMFVMGTYRRTYRGW